MERSALSIIELEIDKNITPGFWGNEGWCCGTVGIAIYLDFMFQLTKDPIYLSFLENLNGKILKSANSSSKGLSWIHAENRRSPEVMYAQTGLMQGAAGFGLYFLRMHYREVGGRPSISLPDEIGL